MSEDAPAWGWPVRALLWLVETVAIAVPLWLAVAAVLRGGPEIPLAAVAALTDAVAIHAVETPT